MMISLPEYPFYIALVPIVALWTMTLVFKKKSKKSNIPMVPYVLPYFGAAFSIKRMGGIVKWARSKLVYCGPIFQAYIAGRTYIFVADPVAARQLLNLNRTDLHSPITELFSTFSGLALKDTETLNSKSGRLHVIIANIANYGKVSETIIQGQQQIKQMISSQIKRGWTKSGLLELVGKMTYYVAVSQLFEIPELEKDNHFDNMRLVLHDMYLLSAAHPYLQEYSNSQAFMAREAIISLIRQHLIKIEQIDENAVELCYDERAKGGLVQSANKLFKENGVSIDERARIMFQTLLATLFNLMPTAFWLFYHLLKNPVAKQDIHDEIRKILKLRDVNSTTANAVFTLDELNRMVKLDSVVTETLRFDTTHDMVLPRRFERDMDLKLKLADGKKMDLSVSRGSYAIILLPVAHRDEEVFTNANDFVWDRFVPGDDGKSIEFHKSGKVLTNPVEAFASGPFYCPGRNFALYFLKAIVSNLLLECDIRFADDVIPKSPGYRKTRSATGWTELFTPESDVEIEFRRRMI